MWRIPNSAQCRHCCDLIPCCLDSAALDSPLHPCAPRVTVIVLALKSDHVGPLPKPREGLPCQSTRLCGSRGPVIGLLFAHSACAPRPPSWHCAQSSPACTLSCYRCPDTHTLFLPLPQPLLDSAQMFPLSAFTPLGRPSIPLCLLFLAAPSPPDIRCHDLFFVFPLLEEETLGFVYLLGWSCWRTTALGDIRIYWGCCLPSQKL